MSDSPTPTVELFVRSLLPQGAAHRQEAVIDRLKRLERDDVIDDCRLVVWGDRIARESAAAQTSQGQYVLNRVAEFQQWALGNNVTLDSFYETREAGSEPGEEYSTIILPVMGLAEYRHGELVQLAPSTHGDDVYTIQDHLDRIARGDPAPAETATEMRRLV